MENLIIMRGRPLLVRMQKFVIGGILFFFLITSVVVLVNQDRAPKGPSQTEASAQRDSVEQEVRHWEGEAARDPQNPFTHRNLGLAYLRANRLAEAKAEYQKALGIDSKDSLSHRYLGEIAFLQKNPDEALAHFDKAVALQPYEPELHFNRGVVLGVAKRYKESAAAFKKAAEISPRMFAQGRLFLERQREDARGRKDRAAINALDEALSALQEKAP